MDEETCIKFLQSKGYSINKLTEKERMIQHILKTYDELSKKGKKELMQYVMILKFINENKDRFKRFCFKERVSIDL